MFKPNVVLSHKSCCKIELLPNYHPSCCSMHGSAPTDIEWVPGIYRIEYLYSKHHKKTYRQELGMCDRTCQYPGLMSTKPTNGQKLSSNKK